MDADEMFMQIMDRFEILVEACSQKDEEIRVLKAKLNSFQIREREYQERVRRDAEGQQKLDDILGDK